MEDREGRVEVGHLRNGDWHYKCNPRATMRVVQSIGPNQGKKCQLCLLPICRSEITALKVLDSATSLSGRSMTYAMNGTVPYTMHGVGFDRTVTMS